MLFEFIDVFRISLCSDPPVEVTPLLLKQLPTAVPLLANSRVLTPIARAYMRSWISELEKCGLIFFNQNPSWALPAFVVDPFTKPRMVIDMVPANKSMVKYYFPMPHLQSFGCHLQNSIVYFTLDCFKGYWQFPVEGDLDCQSFVTPFGVYTPTRVCQGNCNGVFAFQRGMHEIFGDLVPGQLLIWLDDVLGFSPDCRSLLLLLRSVFKLCRKFCLKLSVSKCRFFLREALWCGNVYSEKGVSPDPGRIQALSDFGVPQTAGDLMQFVCAATWLSSSIPDFSRKVGPLRQLLEDALCNAPVRTKKFASRILLSDLAWNETHTNSFNSVIDSIKNSVTLSYPSSDLVPCLFTDASKDFWMVVVTQVPECDLHLPFKEQSHQPLAFCSGAFKKSSANWSVPEKEAFPIQYAVRRFDYLLCTGIHPFRIFTDHRNLVFLYNPESVKVFLNRHSLDKVHRWRLNLDGKSYIIESISGDDNVWADIGTRWGVSPSALCLTLPCVFRLRLPRFAPGIVQPLQDPCFEWPSLPEISSAQSEYFSEAGTDSSLICVEGLYLDTSRLIFIPPTASQLKLRILIIAHCGLSGHCGTQATLQNVRSRFYWKGVSDDASTFCRQCLHCTVNRGGKVVPRPLGSAIHSNVRNFVLHFDYLHVELSRNKQFKYLFVVRDDLSSFTDIFPCLSPTAAFAAECLFDWICRYGIPSMFVSDQGSHFLNSLIEELCLKLHIRHHFTLAYCPWSNGTAEVVNRRILHVL
ncbi:MAG: RNase H-like domain-containing protein, partial [Nitrososphaerales archaeon]